MQGITQETRKGSYLEILPKRESRRQIILSLLDQGPMTASEITEALLQQGVIRYYDRNFAAPRLTELKQAGRVAVVGKRICPRTGKLVAVWGRV